MERETVEGEACQELLAGHWDEYLVREKDILKQQELEEEEARKKDELEHPEIFMDDKNDSHYHHDPYFDKYGARLDKEKSDKQ